MKLQDVEVGQEIIWMDKEWTCDIRSPGVIFLRSGEDHIRIVSPDFNPEVASPLKSKVKKLLSWNLAILRAHNLDISLQWRWGGGAEVECEIIDWWDKAGVIQFWVDKLEDAQETLREIYYESSLYKTHQEAIDDIYKEYGDEAVDQCLMELEHERQ